LIGTLVNYLPFQFQAVRGQDPRLSGITNLAFLVPLMLSPLVSGFLISLIGWYVPFMFIGAAVAAVGSGLITTLEAATPLAAVYGYQFLAGFGSGLCHQIPYTAILHVLPAADMVAGSALCSFVNSLGAIIGIVGAQAIFATLVMSNLGNTVGLDRQGIIAAGPTRIEEVVPAAVVDVVRDAYSESLQKAYLLPTVAAVLCFVVALGMEWRRAKD
jgi:MFS family permease